MLLGIWSTFCPKHKNCKRKNKLTIQHNTKEVSILTQGTSETEVIRTRQRNDTETLGVANVSIPQGNLKYFDHSTYLL